MHAVGIRELKNKLSEYIRLVRAGEEVLVTDRGEVVAVLAPPGRSALKGLSPGLAKLVGQGDVRLGLPNRPDVYRRFPPIAPPGTAQQLLDAERGER